jgi:hypothetical protein
MNLSWKQLEPFEDVDEDTGESEIGFTIKSESESIDFFTGSTVVLDKWLKALGKVMIMTGCTEEY